jgi:4-nitrophenyl phosphatase
MSDIPFLGQIRCFLFDMDGTIYIGEQLLPGAKEVFELIRRRDVTYLILTNNSSKHRGLYAEKLRRLGLNIPDEKVFTSGEATAIHIRRNCPEARIFLVGTPSLEEEFLSQGFTLDTTNPEMAVLGFDTTLTYDKLWRLCDLVRAGMPYIATHHDFNCPVEGGFMPDIGATIAFVEAATGRRPDIIIGKPNKPIVEAVREKTGVPLEATCMIGDRLHTDIALGLAGIRTILTLSGETKRSDVSGSEYKPDAVIQNLAELARALAVI